MAKISRRLLLGASAGSLLLLTLKTQASGNRFLAVRLFPAQNYTRVALESDAKVRYKYFMLTHPQRLVIDVENTDLNNVFNNISQKIRQNDPYIANIRAAQKDSKTVRIVLDLKKPVSPQIFTLNPSGNFKHRLMIDLYAEGSKDQDPILAFWDSRQDGATAAKPAAKPAAKAKPAAARRPVVVLDPGHGGKDKGATSPGGIHEKDVVLSVAKETKKLMEAMGYEVKMTRTSDVYIPLEERRLLAGRVQADVFVSIHANSVTNPVPRGAEIYTWHKNGAKSAEARMLEQKENNADNVAGVKMSNSKAVNHVLLDMVQNQTLNDSNRLARLVLNRLSKYIPLKKNFVDHADFVVLRSMDIPSILVETAFLSNPQDEALLRSRDFHRKTAQAISDGVKQYLSAAVLARR